MAAAAGPKLKDGALFAVPNWKLLLLLSEGFPGAAVAPAAGCELALKVNSPGVAAAGLAASLFCGVAPPPKEKMLLTPCPDGAGAGAENPAVVEDFASEPPKEKVEEGLAAAAAAEAACPNWKGC